MWDRVMALCDPIGSSGIFGIKPVYKSSISNSGHSIVVHNVSLNSMFHQVTG